MSAIDNLVSLHNQEEELRAKSLEAIKGDATLSDHWNLVAEAMNVIYAFTHDHIHESENELTLQYLGIRLFNAAGASIKLALSGYYQAAFHQVRDVIETQFLGRLPLDVSREDRRVEACGQKKACCTIWRWHHPQRAR
jgi:hypothetical protein